MNLEINEGITLLLKDGDAVIQSTLGVPAMMTDKLFYWSVEMMRNAMDRKYKRQGKWGDYREEKD